MNDYGADFVKKAGLLGSVIILIISALGTVLMFTAHLGAPQPYEPLHATDYYAQGEASMAGLIEELEEHIFPSFDTDIRADVVLLGDGRYVAVITADRGYLDRVRAAVLRSFDASLFEFRDLETYVNNAIG